MGAGDEQKSILRSSSKSVGKLKTQPGTQFLTQNVSEICADKNWKIEFNRLELLRRTGGLTFEQWKQREIGRRENRSKQLAEDGRLAREVQASWNSIPAAPKPAGADDPETLRLVAQLHAQFQEEEEEDRAAEQAKLDVQPSAPPMPMPEPSAPPMPEDPLEQQRELDRYTAELEAKAEQESLDAAFQYMREIGFIAPKYILGYPF